MCVSNCSNCRCCPDRPAQILKDEKKRAAFDQYGASSQQPGFDPEAFARNPFAGGFGQRLVVVADNPTSLINFLALLEGEVAEVLLLLRRMLGVRISKLVLE